MPFLCFRCPLSIRKKHPRYFVFISLLLRFALLPRAVDDLNLGDPRNNRCVKCHMAVLP